MSDSKALTTLSDAQYLQSSEYKAHVEHMLASYDHPPGILSELGSQMADAFWWVRVYRAERDQLLVTEMADELVYRQNYEPDTLALWLAMFEILSDLAAKKPIDDEDQRRPDEVLDSKGRNLDSLRSVGLSRARGSYETLDRLIERQLKNVRLLMQSYDSVRFAPQVYKKMALEIEQLELQVKQSREDQRLEVDRQ